MSGKTPTYDPKWQAKYAGMIWTAAQAVKEIMPGQRVFIGSACAQPQQLVKALVARAGELTDIEIIDLLSMGDAPYAQPELSGYFRVNSFFITEKVRRLIQEGLGDYTPIFLSDIPRLFTSGQLPLDVALIQITPPDERGYASFGVSVDIVKSAAANASLVIAQVNSRMPRTLGDSFINVHDVDVLVPGDEPIIEIPVPETDALTRRIGEHVAALVEDGATIELGIGRVPHAVLEFLKDKREIGIHTEMLNDAIIDVIEAGVVTGRRKSLDRDKVVASFCMGTKKLYDYIDNNPAFSFHPTEYVNDPFIIGQQQRMVAINVALEVDLTGQVCSDSLGSKFFSGIGGQVDFNRGAARADRGKAIIAMPSTARNGTISRIVTRLNPGAGVVTTRGDVHYVVTEYGVAYLHGKRVQDRALALISIAHPDFREQLLREAVAAKYMRAELAEVEDRLTIVSSPDMHARYVLNDGTQINFRPTHPTDAPRMKDLFYALSQQTIYYRYMHAMKSIPQRTLLNTVFVDHRHDVAIVGTVPEATGEEIIAVGRYYLDPKTNRAEVAFTVHDDWQNRGIGSFLLRLLTTVARRNGIAGFTAEVLRENKAMQAVFNKSALKVNSRLEGTVYHFDLDFS
ncbi:MAG: GNAT family N-acetyltransferase [Planctomycetes bacterium]|nr:GNAT family N-acetyltransferase [Planctomycetota bacterium]